MLRVEIASTPSQQAQGLMFRRELSPDRGMVFMFRRAQKLSFWGVNTYIPLDIAFVDDENRIVEIKDIKPLSERMVQSEQACKMAIEANLGYFNGNNIKLGDYVKIDSESGEIFFERGDGILDTFKQAQRFLDYEDDEPASLQEYPEITPYNIDGYIEDNIEDREVEQTEIPNPNEPVMVEPQDEFEEEQGPPADLPDIPVPEEDYPDFPDDNTAMDWAAKNDEAVVIWYRTKRGTIIQRIVEPHGQFVAPGTGNIILVTWDRTPGINDIRAFIVPNILNHQFIGDKFDRKFSVSQGEQNEKIEKPTEDREPLMMEWD